MSTSAESQVVAITGGAGGIGLAAARRLGRKAHLLLADVNTDRLDDARAALEGEGHVVSTVVCDVTSAESVAGLAGTAKELGRLGVLVHTAGLSPSMADARSILSVNYLGTWNLLEAFEPLLGEGSVVVCVASMAAYRQKAAAFDELLGDPREPGVLDDLVDAAANQSRPAYALSKRGVHREVERRAASLAARGARIVSVSPGVVDTEMGRLEAGAGGRGNMQVALSTTPLGRLASADEVAGTIALLCDPVASYVTGCDLLIDGATIAGYRHHASDAAKAGFDDPWE